MRYILNSDGYIYDISFGAEILCALGNCTEYTGEIPTGYSSLIEWHDEELERLNAWKIVEGNLVYDSAKYAELKKQREKDEIDNACVRHKELYELENKIDNIIDVTSNQYVNQTSTGTLISIDGAKRCYPRIKFTSIEPYEYDHLTLVVNGKNMLCNEATTKTISGITFTQNEDRSITINGTATEDIEYDIVGTSTNTSPFLCIKKETDYYLSSNKQKIKMYHYDGTDRTEIYNGSGGSIRFTDSDKLVTHVILSVSKGATFDKVTIYPQLEYGTSGSDYETYKATTLDINFSDYIDELMYPSDDLYPSDYIYPNDPTIIDYISIKDGIVYIGVNGVEEHLGIGNIAIYDGYNNVYTMEDTYIEMEYSTTILNVDNLDFLLGKETSNKQFKVLKDASIEVNNIYMYNGAKIIGGDGMITNLQFKSGDWFKMLGYQFVGGYDNIKEVLDFNVFIPENFVISSAIITLFNTPFYWTTYDNENVWGYAQNIDLYKIGDTSNLYAQGIQDSEYKFNDTDYIKIENAFNGYSFPEPTMEIHKSTMINSADIKDDLNTGINILRIQTSNESSTGTSYECARQTSFCIATLNVIGYMNYGKGVDE